MPIDKSKAFERVLNAAKPHLEAILEQNLESLLKIPLLRDLFNISPGLMVSVLSIAIGEIKEQMNQHPWIKASIDLLEVIPREIQKILEVDARGMPIAGTANPAHALRMKKGMGRGHAMATTPLPAELLAVLDKKFATGDGRIGKFIGWFAKLTPEDRKKVETCLLTDSSRLGIFLALTTAQKNQFVRALPKLDPELKGQEIGTIFIDRYARHSEAQSKRVKTYGLGTRLLYAIAGYSIDKNGVRKS